MAAGGGEWAAPWMVAVNLPVTMLHAPYVRSFKGFQRPWHHLAQLLEDVHVQELGLGSGYILTGQAPPRTRQRFLAPSAVADGFRVLGAVGASGRCPQRAAAVSFC